MCKADTPLLRRLVEAKGQGTWLDDMNWGQSQLSNQDHSWLKTTSPYTRCNVCTESHRIWECRIFKEKCPAQRAKVVAKAKLCFSCLRETTCSGSAQLPENVGKMVATAPITHFSIELRWFNLLVGNHRIRPLQCHLSAMCRLPNCSCLILRLKIPRFWFCAIPLAVTLGCQIVLQIDLVCTVKHWN